MNHRQNNGAAAWADLNIPDGGFDLEALHAPAVTIQELLKSPRWVSATLSNFRACRGARQILCEPPVVDEVLQSPTSHRGMEQQPISVSNASDYATGGISRVEATPTMPHRVPTCR